MATRIHLRLRTDDSFSSQSINSEETSDLEKMPALKAFNISWKIGSDDFVFPYMFSIFMRCLWFASIVYVLVDYDKQYQCDDEHLLKIYICTLMGLQIVAVFIQLIVIIVSSRGTIADSHPRRYLKWILYIQTVVFVVELIWDIVGVVWSFDPTIDCSSSHQVLILARIVLTWNLISSVSIATYVLIRIGVCELVCPRTPDRLRYEKLKPSRSFGGRRLSRVSSYSMNQHKRQRKWQWYLQNMFCCINLKEKQKNVFTEVSATLATAFTKFRGYVLSDILAGMALLRMKQSNERKKREDYGGFSSTRKLLKFSEKGVSSHTKRMARYLKYSMGSYGWMLFVYTKGLSGLLKLLFKSLCCCLRKKEDGELSRTIIGDNWFKGSTHSILTWTGINEMDIIYANFNSEVYCPAFYVALDHKERSVVVSIRGTLSVLDALTDLSAHPGLLMTKDSVKFYAHQGMINTAQCLHLKLEGEGILQRIFHIYPSYKLVITGHSLGAGVGALLAMLLQPIYPKLHCYAYSPPGGLINMPAVHHTKPFITSIVLGDDLVPRLSLQNFELFSEQVLHQLQTSRVPKFQIFIDSFLHWAGLKTPKYHCHKDSTENLINIEAFTTKTKQNAHGLTLDSDEELFDDEDENDMKQLSDHHINTDPITGKRIVAPRERPDLFLPGRIIHLTKGPPLANCFGLCRYRPIIAEWTAQTEFSEMLLDKDIVSDHMPNALLNVLNKLIKQERIQ